MPRRSTGHEPVRQVELVADVAVRVRGDVDVAVPGAAPVVVHEDVDDLAWLPVRAGQCDEATGRVVVEVAGDRRRGDRLGRRGLSGRFGGGCGCGRRRRLFWRRLRSGLRRWLGGWLLARSRLRRRLGASVPSRARRRASAMGSDRRSALRPGRRSARQGSRPAGIPAGPRAVGGVTGGRIGAPESSRFPAPCEDRDQRHSHDVTGRRTRGREQTRRRSNRDRKR